MKSLEICNQHGVDIESAKASLATLSASLPVLVFAFAFVVRCTLCYCSLAAEIGSAAINRSARPPRVRIETHSTVDRSRSRTDNRYTRRPTPSNHPPVMFNRVAMATDRAMVAATPRLAVVKCTGWTARESRCWIPIRTGSWHDENGSMTNWRVFERVRG